jgi:hypothetical protein
LTEHPVSQDGRCAVGIVGRHCDLSILNYSGATLAPHQRPLPHTLALLDRIATRRRTRVGTYPPSARPRRRGRCCAIYSTAAA